MREQREAGKNFVLRIRIRQGPRDMEDIEGQMELRAVIMNPMTDMDILNEVLDEQEEIAKKNCNLLTCFNKIYLALQ